MILSFHIFCLLLGISHFTTSFRTKPTLSCKRNYKPVALHHHLASVDYNFEKGQDLQYPLGKIAFSLLPFSPESNCRRKTLLTTIVPDKIWTLDQLQGVLHVNVPVRSTIIALKSGGLFINNPVAPTKECISLIRHLEERYGEVKYLVLSTLAVEHKGTTGSTARYFPDAEVYLQKGQYAFPFNLPTYFFLPPFRKVFDIPKDPQQAPWYGEIDHVSIGPLKPKNAAGGFAETVFFHRDTRTLLVTDSIISVPSEPPAIVHDDPRSLLYHARDTQLQVVRDTPEIRRKGWRRISIFALMFQPSGIRVNDVRNSLQKIPLMTPEMKALGRRVIPISEGLYPWDWIESEELNFQALQRKGRGGLLVPPILQKLIFNREPEVVLQWIDSICQWNFNRIISCHFANDIKAGPSEVRQAFGFLSARPSSKILEVKSLLNFQRWKQEDEAFQRDLKVLIDASTALTTQGVLFPGRSIVTK